MSSPSKKEIIMALLDNKIYVCEYKEVPCEFYDKKFGCVLATLGVKDCIKKEGEPTGEAKEGRLS